MRWISTRSLAIAGPFFDQSRRRWPQRFPTSACCELGLYPPKQAHRACHFLLRCDTFPRLCIRRNVRRWRIPERGSVGPPGTKAPTIGLSTPNSTAFGLAVYASQGRLLRPTQDSLPVAGQALPDGLSTHKIPMKGFKIVSLHLYPPFPSFAWHNGGDLRRVMASPRLRTPHHSPHVFARQLGILLGICDADYLAVDLV